MMPALPDSETLCKPRALKPTARRTLRSTAADNINNTAAGLTMQQQRDFLRATAQTFVLGFILKLRSVRLLGSNFGSAPSKLATGGAGG